MANAFTLFGELKVDSASFRAAMNFADNRAKASERLHSQLEQQKARAATQTSLTQQRLAAQAANTQTRAAAAVQRATIQSETAKQRIAAQSAQAQARLNLAAEAAAAKSEQAKLRLAQTTANQQQRLAQQSSQFQQRMATQASVRFEREQQRMQAAAARAANAAKFSWSRMQSVFSGTLLAGGVAGMGLAVKSFVTDSVKMFGTLDKLVRFTATLDEKFQSPKALRKLREDIMQLSTEIPHSAESIAQASFTIKSAFQDISQTDLIDYLREFGNAATASNTDIASHAFNMAALAKQYKIAKQDLPKFGALIASSFGQALAADAQVAEGFNKILNSAKSTKQPLEDMVAAMSTLQSASSDAQMNTTLLLNVYSKLTDPKYIAGIKEMGVSVFDATGNFRSLNDIINDMAKELQGLSDQEINAKLEWAKDAQAREGIKTLVRLVGDYNKQLKDGADEEAFKKKNELMLNSVEARWEKFVNKINNLKMSTGAIIADLSEGKFGDIGAHGQAGGFDQPGQAAARWAKSYAAAIKNNRGLILAAFTGAIGPAIDQAVKASEAQARAGGMTIGQHIAAGMAGGVSSGQGQLGGAITGLANWAIQTAKHQLGIQSPSKVFKAIGQDVAQGFIDGIASMKTGVQKAMGDLLDVSQIFGKLGQKDVPGVQLLTSLIKELDELTPRTRLEAVMAELTAEKYKKLNEEVRKRIILAAQQLDLEEKRKKLAELWKDAKFEPVDFEGTGFEPNAEGTGTGFSLPDPTVAQQVAESIKEMMDALRAPIPPPLDPWNNFWAMMQRELGRFSASLPSIKESIGTNLLDSIAGIGDVFANAIAYWDGTAKGFFQSLAQGFRQMIQQIIAELIRLMVMKAILNIIGSFAKAPPVSSLGGMLGLGSTGFEFGNSMPGGAAGGMVSGPGTSTSDSIFARLSKGEFVVNAKAVREVGRGFMEHLNAGFPGTPMLAAGGYVGSSSMTTNNSWAPQFTINVSGGGNPEKVKQSVKQGVSEAMRMMEHQRRRNK